MHLLLTRYLDAEPDTVSRRLRHAVGAGLDSAARRIDSARTDAAIEPSPSGVRLSGGLAQLDGSELRVGGEHDLTILEVVVPWTTADRDGSKLLAANAFAHSVATQVATEAAAA